MTSPSTTLLSPSMKPYTPTAPFTLPKIRRYLAGKPSETWNSHAQHLPDGTCCVLGHLEDLTGIGHNLFWDRLPQAEPILGLFAPLRSGQGAVADALAVINNGDDPRYRQKTPRARVLQAIDDLIAGTIPTAPV